MRVNYAIVFVSDMARSIEFYQNVLGLPLKFDSSHWTEFATEGATLALHKSEELNPGNNPKLEVAGHCRPGFQVPDLDQFHNRMLEKNIPCLQEPKTVFGARLAQYQDPDGLVISIGEEPKQNKTPQGG